MKKFINFCKKPLLIISSCLFFAFMVVLIVACAVPHGNHYIGYQKVNMESGSIEVNTNMTVKVEVTFKKDNVMEMKATTLVDGKEVTVKELYPTMTDDQIEEYLGLKPNDKMVVTQQGKYSIKNGVLYGTAEGETEETEFGKINALKIRLTTVAMFNGEELVLTCKLNQGLEIASIVLMSVSAALVVASITLIVLDKKGLLNKKEKQENV